MSIQIDMKIILIVLLSVFSNTIYSNEVSKCSKAELINKENVLITSTLNKNTTFSVRVFGRKLNIPKRYELILHGPIGDSVVFSTSLNTQDDYQSQIGCDSQFVITGNIEIGDYSKCELCNQSFLKKNGFTIVNVKSLNSLKFIEAKLEGGTIGVFYNDENYMSVQDENESLLSFIWNDFEKQQ